MATGHNKMMDVAILPVSGRDISTSVRAKVRADATAHGGNLRMFRTWWDLGMLAAESQQVMWLRYLKLAAGGSKASAETRRMVSEKVAVAAQAGIGAMLGDAPGRVVKRYRKKVRANRRRLSK